MKSEIIYGLDQLVDVANELAVKLKDFSIVTLTGELGAGKTTLTKRLLRSWGVDDEILSPTFTYVNCYKNDQGKKFFHFDLYRIKDLDSFFELGFDEYLNQPDSMCIIEWPQVINSLLNSNVCHIKIEHISDDERRLTEVF